MTYLLTQLFICILEVCLISISEQIKPHILIPVPVVAEEVVKALCCLIRLIHGNLLPVTLFQITVKLLDQIPFMV